jgi:leucyl aminopeptidase (aminopeptidase T)
MSPEANFGNFPAGEVFITPEAVHGVFVADEVIVIDQSYLLKRPLIVELRGNEYEVVDGPKEILDVIRRERRKAWKRIETWEAMGVPKDLVELNKKNFMNVGEFAVGLNPNARVSRYLIEAEKIDRTVHMALGSGYDPDRPTTYHWDSVAGWNQKLSVTAIKEGREIPILKDGGWKI